MASSEGAADPHREAERERRQRIQAMTPIERMEEAFRLYMMTGGNPPYEEDAEDER